MNPIKPTLKTELLPWLIMTAGVALSFYFYPRFPEQVTSHWNFAGQADGYMGKTAASLFLPVLLVLMYLLFWAVPYIDPKRERYESFAGVYRLFRNLIMSFLLAAYILAGLYNLGYNVDIGTVIPVLAGLLMGVLGNYMEKIKPNWFMGIRTPWTLSSEKVWAKTQKFGGRAFVALGLVLICGPLLPKTIFIILFVAGILLVTLGSFGYSYMLYKKEQSSAFFGH